MWSLRYIRRIELNDASAQLSVHRRTSVTAQPSLGRRLKAAACGPREKTAVKNVWDDSRRNLKTGVGSFLIRKLWGSGKKEIGRFGDIELTGKFFTMPIPFVSLDPNERD